MEDELEVSTIAEAELNVQRLMERVGEITEKTEVGVNKDILAFLGPTKGGKSTLINCLLGTKLICKMNKNTEETSIIKVEDKCGPKIGGSGEPQTNNPQCCGFMPGTNYEMWDFAGFCDNKGTEQEIANAISLQKILLAAEFVRFVLVVPCEMIKDDNLLPFYKLLNEFQKICPEIADSLSIVFTKFDKGNTKKLLEDAKDKKFPKTNKKNTDIINQGKIIIENILNNNNYIDFKAPKMDEEEDKIFILPNKQQFIDCISKLRGTKVKDFPLVISDQAKHVIAELYTVFYQKVKKEVENTNYFIDKYIQNKINEILEAKEEDGKPTSEASKLDNLENEKTKFDEVIEKSKDFKTFFYEIENLKFEINKEFSENIEKFNFVEKLKNWYKSNEKENFTQGELEFLNFLKDVLKRGSERYRERIVNVKEDNKETEIERQKLDEINDLRKQVNNLENSNTYFGVNVIQTIINWFYSVWNYFRT